MKNWYMILSWKKKIKPFSFCLGTFWITNVKNPEKKVQGNLVPEIINPDHNRLENIVYVNKI